MILTILGAFTFALGAAFLVGFAYAAWLDWRERRGLWNEPDDDPFREPFGDV